MPMNALTKYHALIQSFPLSQARIGIMKAGRYCGFDTMEEGNTGEGIPVIITHDGAEITPVGSDNAYGDKEGVVLTPHGVVIKCTDEIELNVAIGGAPKSPSHPVDVGDPMSFERIDVVYLEYEWLAEDIGFEPFVGLIQGSQGGGIPSLGNPETQVALGYITVANGANEFSELVYTPAKVPSLGGANIILNYPELGDVFAKLAGKNAFSKYQRVIPKSLDLSLDAGGYILLDESSNTYLINCNNTSGAEIYGIRPGAGLTYPDGVRLFLYFYNVGPRSFLAKSEDSTNPPGFVFPDGGILRGDTFPLPNNTIIEFIKLPSRTWWATDMFPFVGSQVKTLQDQVTTLLANLVSYTPKNTVPEYSSGLTDAFKYSYFTNAGIPNNYKLKYRINRAGDLEISGQLFSLATTYPGSTVNLFQLPDSYNPDRMVAFPVLRRRVSGTWETLTGYLGPGGIVQINFGSTAGHEATLFINVQISFA